MEDAPLPPESTAVPISGSVATQREYGLRRGVLTPWETLAQSVAAIAPTATPVLTIPLVFAQAGNGTWVAYVFATFQITLIALLIGATRAPFRIPRRRFIAMPPLPFLRSHAASRGGHCCWVM